MTSQSAIATTVNDPTSLDPNGRTATTSSASLNLGPSHLPKARRLGKGARLYIVLGVLAVMAGGAGGAWYLVNNAGAQRADILTHIVKPERMEMTVVERGTLESAVNRDVVCRVKARTQGSQVASTIKWVIDDGSHVKQGQILAELDSSGLQELLKQQRITLDQAEAKKISSEENYNIVISQNNSEIKTAEVTLLLAEIELKKYLEGDYQQAKKDIEGRIAMAKSDLEMWQERASWSVRMSKRNFVTATQAQADQARMQGATIALKKIEEEMRVLEDPDFGEKRRKVTDLTSKIEEAKRALDRVKKQARAKDATADADRKANQSIYYQELSKFNEIEEEIRKCIITAPQDGLVVYYIPEQTRFGSGSQQSIVAQGEPVREGQKLMQIPDLSKMLVNTKVHEAMISRVRGERWKRTGFSDGVQATLISSDPMTCLLGQFAFLQGRQDFGEKYKMQEQELLYGGQPAEIRVDAFTDVGRMKGHIKTVATVASQNDWMSSDVKVYQTMVAIDETHEGLKPGMSAEVTIYTDGRVEDVLAIPVQAVLGTNATGKTRQCYLLTKEGPQPRDITIGMTNEKTVEILSGLEEGDVVILNPRSVLTDKDKARLQAAANKASGNGKNGDGPKGEGKGKGKGEGKGKGKGFDKSKAFEAKGDDAGDNGAPKAGKGKMGPGGRGGADMQNMNPEDRQKMFDAFKAKLRAASPPERKKMLEVIPQEGRDMVKQLMKAEGIDIPD